LTVAGPGRILGPRHFVRPRARDGRTITACGPLDPSAGAVKRELLLRLVGVVPDRRRQKLAQLGITKSRTSDLPVWILATLLAAAAAVATGAVATHSLSSDVAIGAASAMITVAGLLVAVLQWRAGLAEKALDALYQRIAFANQMRVKASEGLGSDDESEIARERPTDYRFFVFTEIDSLEYAAVRYRFGLGMTDLIADRAVDHFRRRCETSDQFWQTARECVTEGAYFEDTKAIVTKILDGLVHEAGQPTMAELSKTTTGA
jgi:hypothetical protein